MESLPLQQLADALRIIKRYSRPSVETLLFTPGNTTLIALALIMEFSFWKIITPCPKRCLRKNGMGYICGVSMRWQSISLRGL